MLKTKNLLRLALAESRTPADFALTSPPEAPWTFRVSDNSTAARHTKLCRVKTIQGEPSVSIPKYRLSVTPEAAGVVGAACSLPDRVEIARFPTAFESRLLGAANAEQGQTSLYQPWSWSLADGCGRRGAGKNCTGHGSAKINI